MILILDVLFSSQREKKNQYAEMQMRCLLMQLLLLHSWGGWGGRGGESKKSKVFAMGQFWPMSLSTLVFLKKTLFYSSQSWAAVYLVIINQALFSLRFFKQSFSGMINLRPTFHFKREGRANGLAFQSCLPPQISRYPCHSHLLEVTAEAD